MASPRTNARAPHRLDPPSKPPISACRELWERLVDRRLLQPPATPGTLAHLDRFQVVREIGAGGMGVVLLARDPQPRKPRTANGDAPHEFVAIKVLRPELADHPRSLERFLSEARHMQQLDHPHILRVIEISPSRSRPYLVMPHLHGGNLAQQLQQHGPPSPRDTLRLALEIASALNHAHRRGIIHRDLKPANVLLNDRGQAVLTDFGLARTVFNEGIPDLECDHREGTAPYMSPAVARGEAEDTRCDIYAFGALLYETLTGQPPYSGTSHTEVTRKILAGPPPHVLEIQPAAPARLARIAHWAMARELRHRYAHMIDVSADLQRVESGVEPLGPQGHRGWLVSLGLGPLPHGKPATLMAFALLTALTAGLTFLTTPLATSPSTTSIRVVPSPPTPPTPEVSVPSTGICLADTCFLVRQGALLMLQTDASPTQSDPTSPLRILRRFMLPQTSPHPDPAVRARVDLVDDLDGDGHNELLVRVTTSASNLWTLLCCYDLDSAALRWVHTDDNDLLPPRTIDFDGDGSLEILLLTRGSALSPPRLHLLNCQGQRRSVLLPRSPIACITETGPDGTTRHLRILDEDGWLQVLDPHLEFQDTQPILADLE
jgi:serine/threonine protein kinase